MTRNPVVFVGSSTESKSIAQSLTASLRKVAQVKLWTTVFEPGSYPIETIQAEAAGADFAVFVFSADDTTISRHRKSVVPRDNVIFEAGLFMAVLGRERTFLVVDDRARLKLPSDLFGFTTLRYNGVVPAGDRRPGYALREAREKLLARIEDLGPRPLADVSSSLLHVVQEIGKRETRRPFSVIIRPHLAAITNHLDRLYAAKNYERHAAAALPLRRIFEDTGAYADGIRVNQKLVLSLRKLDRAEDAMWARVKGVAYLQVLSGEHADARQLLTELLHETEADQATWALLRAYAHRYLGVSYERDYARSDLARARRHFESAGEAVDLLSELQPHEHQRFRAKLDRNLGNLDIEQHRDHDTAIARFERSRLVFDEISDYEHHGISTLAKAKAMIAKSEADKSPLAYAEVSALVGQAERSAMLLGWTEGVGNAQEARATLLLQQARHAAKAKSRERLLDEALHAAQSAQASFALTDARHRADRATALVDRIGMQRHERRPSTPAAAAAAAPRLDVGD